MDKAACSSIIWDPKVFNGVMQMNENTVIKEFHSSENEYFHPDFHSSMNMGIEYLGTAHGEKDVKEYLAVFAKNAYKALLDKMKSDPLGALKKHIEATYALEKASDALTLYIEGDTLSVSVSYCPAVKHLRKTGRAVSKWFSYTTEEVMQTIANELGLHFTMEAYDEETGAAKYSFTKGR